MVGVGRVCFLFLLTKKSWEPAEFVCKIRWWRLIMIITCLAFSTIYSCRILSLFWMSTVLHVQREIVVLPIYKPCPSFNRMGNRKRSRREKSFYLYFVVLSMSFEWLEQWIVNSDCVWETAKGRASYYDLN